jgi:hypothetical protein
VFSEVDPNIAANIAICVFFPHVMQRDESHITKRVMSMNVDRQPSKGWPRKRWIDCVKHDMRKKE